LFLNNKSLGKKKVEKYSHVEWQINYMPGKLKAIGYKNGKVVAETKLETTGCAHSIVLTPDATVISANAEDIVIVKVTVVDEYGRIVPTADNDISFTLEGPAKILGVGNGNPSKHEPPHVSHVRAFNGLCQIILQSTNDAGAVKLTAESTGLVKSVIEIELTACDRRPFVRSGSKDSILLNK